ncbi:helicase POLQ-like [Sander vitreus]
MNSGKQEIQIKRVSSRKRSRDGLKTRLTPARKRGGNPGTQHESCPNDWKLSSIMADVPAAEQFCSDSEDLFGDYDSLLEDSSLLAKLDDAEQMERQRSAADRPPPGFTSLRPENDAAACEDLLTDSILDVLGDEPFEDTQQPYLPASQHQFHQQVQENAQRSRENTTSTPLRDPEGERRPQGKRQRPTPARRSVTEQLKSTMLCNAAAPSAVSRAAQMKEAVVSEEISVAMQAMETVSAAETMDFGPFFGLPTKVKELMFNLRGIETLYEWQETCLNLDCVQRRKNLIYSLPTSGGKTLVAEILVLRELLCRKKDSLFILPYISLVQEKVRGLASFGLELDFMVEEYAGSKGRFPPVKRRNNRSVFVATIEKAHSLVNSLIESGRIHDLGLVVVDELHMLGDGSRGAVIEMTLAKVLYMSKSTQIIGMSATLGNIRDLQTFLKADNYTNNFRPVQLKEYVKLSSVDGAVRSGLSPQRTDLRGEKLVEEAYSSGVLCLLACTSTLAAGINLPARRVILRSPYVATDFLKRSQYKQMVGRAGRAGIDSVGESILILQDKDTKMAKTLVSAPMENCYSNLMHDEGKGLLSLILSLIGLNVNTINKA